MFCRSNPIDYRNRRPNGTSSIYWLTTKNSTPWSRTRRFVCGWWIITYNEAVYLLRTRYGCLQCPRPLPIKVELQPQFSMSQVPFWRCGFKRTFPGIVVKSALESPRATSQASRQVLWYIYGFGTPPQSPPGLKTFTDSSRSDPKEIALLSHLSICGNLWYGGCRAISDLGRACPIIRPSSDVMISYVS